MPIDFDTHLWFYRALGINVSRVVLVNCNIEKIADNFSEIISIPTLSQSQLNISWMWILCGLGCHLNCHCSLMWCDWTSFGNKPSPERMMTNYQWCLVAHFHVEKKKKSILDISVKVADWRIQLHLSSANELIVLVYTVYPKKYAHDFVVLCFVVVMQSFIMNSHEVFIHIHQGCFAGTGAIVRLPQCQWSKPDGYGKISQCITTTKHSKAKTVCIFLGINCISFGSTYDDLPMATEINLTGHNWHMEIFLYDWGPGRNHLHFISFLLYSMKSYTGYQFGSFWCKVRLINWNRFKYFQKLHYETWQISYLYICVNRGYTVVTITNNCCRHSVYRKPTACDTESSAS